MNPPVQPSLAQSEEGLLAVSARKRPLSCVDEVVSSQCVRFAEALPTIGAWVRPGPGVGDDVFLLGFLALKTFVALRAGVGPVIYVGPVMLGKFSL